MRGFYDFLKSRVHRKIGFVRTINSESIRVLEEDVNGHILYATGTSAATTQDSQAGYAKGAVYVKTDVVTGTNGRYINVGTTASSSFKLETVAA